MKQRIKEAVEEAEKLNDAAQDRRVALKTLQEKSLIDFKPRELFNVVAARYPVGCSRAHAPCWMLKSARSLKGSVKIGSCCANCVQGWQAPRAT
eukprot:276849-Amphidinium_carterae.1